MGGADRAPASPTTTRRRTRSCDTLARYHSAYYVPAASGRPPPLFLASGFTDDLFPADEALRFANRTAQALPGLPMALLLGDFGHQRASNEPRRARGC